MWGPPIPHTHPPPTSPGRPWPWCWACFRGPSRRAAPSCGPPGSRAPGPAWPGAAVGTCCFGAGQGGPGLGVGGRARPAGAPARLKKPTGGRPMPQSWAALGRATQRPSSLPDPFPPIPLSPDTPPSLEASGVLARFVVGVPPPSSRAADEAALAAEASAHGDILRVDVVEEYDNLVLKARAWVGGKEGSGAGGWRARVARANHAALLRRRAHACSPAPPHHVFAIHAPPHPPTHQPCRSYTFCGPQRQRTMPSSTSKWTTTCELGWLGRRGREAVGGVGWEVRCGPGRWAAGRRRAVAGLRGHRPWKGCCGAAAALKKRTHKRL